MVLNDLITNLNMDSIISKNLRNCLITRITERRTEWSDLCLYLNYDQSFRQKSSFYNKPTEKVVEKAGRFLNDLDVEENSVDQEIAVDEFGLPVSSTKPENGSVFFGAVRFRDGNFCFIQNGFLKKPF